MPGVRHASIALAILLTGVCPAWAQPAAPDARDDEQWHSLCGVSFVADWDDVVVPGAKTSLEECSGDVRPRNWTTLVKPTAPSHFFNVSVRVLAQTRAQVTEDFEVSQKNGRWFVGDEASQAPAVGISGDGWEGVLAVVTYRAYARDDGPYLGLSEATFAILWASSGPPRAAILLAGTGAEDTLTLMLNSLRFDVVRAPPAAPPAGFGFDD
jgi:hypothetical protein